MLLSYMNGNSVKYYTYEKWSLPDEFENSYLKDNPKEVKNTYYPRKNDSSLNINSKMDSYEEWKFDNYGNIIFQKLSTNSDSFLITIKYEFTNEGLQSISYANSIPNEKVDTLKIITKKRSNNFLEIQTGLGKPHYSIISFLNNGNTRKEESIADTNNINNISLTQTDYYDDNGMIQKKELKKMDGYTMLTYFYSKEKYLDSIVSYDNDTITTKEIFYNNQFGDPVKYYEFDSKNDTTKIASMKYEYDQHNNWIKKLVKEEDRSIYLQLIDGLKSKSQYLSVREIKY
jgi:hypothetical protein